MVEKKIKNGCDIRRCRKEGKHKVGMFHFCDEHYQEMVVKRGE